MEYTNLTDTKQVCICRAAATMKLGSEIPVLVVERKKCRCHANQNSCYTEIKSVASALNICIFGKKNHPIVKK